MTDTITSKPTLATGTEAGGAARDSQQQLQRRRSDLVRSREAAAAGRAEIARLQARADALQGTSADTKRRLDEAEQLAKRLRKDLKKQDKEREALTKRLRDGGKSLVELDRRVVSREQKYDRAVLADMVEREKARDLASGGRPESPAAAEGAPTPAGTRPSPATAATTEPSPATAVATPPSPATAASEPSSPAPVGRTTEQDKPGEPVTVVEHKADGTTTTTRGTTSRPTTARTTTTRTPGTRTPRGTAPRSTS